MAGSKMPIAVAHGEGYAEFSDANAVNGLLANKLVTMRFIDHASMPTTSYPYNPNGSPQGITGLTSTDGRFSIMMPHPERVIRNVQNTWQRCGDSEDSAWIRMFRNARRHIN
jgi:phosphoribosylformylglycinamidine synthase